MHFSKIYRVKEGKLDTLRQWFEILNGDRKEEALATFEYENITREVFVLFKGDDGRDYVIGLNEANDGYRKGDPTVTINEEHKKIMEDCLERMSGDGEIVLDLHI